MLYFGIDPGKSGAMAVISDLASTAEKPYVRIVPFDEEAYRGVLKFYVEHDYEHIGGAVVERVNAMPGQGVTSMFSFGTNYGYIQGLLAAYGIPYELVLPRVWKKAFGVTSDKNTSIEVAKRMFPTVSFKRTERCRKDDDGAAESALLAAYAKRIFS